MKFIITKETKLQKKYWKLSFLSIELKNTIIFPPIILKHFELYQSSKTFTQNYSRAGNTKMILFKTGLLSQKS